MPGKPASVKGDLVMQTPPVHCHQPHPMGPAPPVPIPAPVVPPLKMASPLSKKVKIGGKPAVRVSDKTKADSLVPCVKAKGGPGEVALGSFTVKIEGKLAARILDMTKHMSCVAPIPAPTGKILGPGVATVMIG